MTFEMHVIYFSHCSQMSLLWYISLEKLRSCFTWGSKALLGLHKYRHGDKHKYSFFMFTEHVRSNQRGVSFGTFQSSCKSIGLHCCISVQFSTVGGQNKGQQFRARNINIVPTNIILQSLACPPHIYIKTNQRVRRRSICKSS